MKLQKRFHDLSEEEQHTFATVLLYMDGPEEMIRHFPSSGRNYTNYTRDAIGTAREIRQMLIMAFGWPECEYARPGSSYYDYLRANAHGDCLVGFDLSDAYGNVPRSMIQTMLADTDKGQFLPVFGSLNESHQFVQEWCVRGDQGLIKELPHNQFLFSWFAHYTLESVFRENFLKPLLDGNLGTFGEQYRTIFSLVNPSSFALSRYVDDFIISCKFKSKKSITHDNVKNICQAVREVFSSLLREQHGQHMSLNERKSRWGSPSLRTVQFGDNIGLRSTGMVVNRHYLEETCYMLIRLMDRGWNRASPMGAMASVPPLRDKHLFIDRSHPARQEFDRILGRLNFIRQVYRGTRSDHRCRTAKRVLVLGDEFEGFCKQVLR